MAELNVWYRQVLREISLGWKFSIFHRTNEIKQTNYMHRLHTNRPRGGRVCGRFVRAQIRVRRHAAIRTASIFHSDANL